MTILSILDCVNATEGQNRPLREGEEMLSAGLLVAVGLKARDNSVLHVQALVLRTSGISTQHPYLVDIWIDSNKTFGKRVIRDQSTECQCKDGQSQKCKHVLAVLIYLARIEEEELEDLSCPDIERQWGVLKASTIKEYEGKMLSDLCHIKSQRNAYVSTLPEVTKEMEKKWQERLMRCKIT